MAYQTRDRSPLLDSNMQAAIEKRGKELIGVAFLVLGAMAAMIIGSYAPTDPSWLSATDAPVQNWMGQFGASIAAPLFMIVGKAAWVIALAAGVWGLRFVVHKGQERALSRLIFLPIAIAVCAVYASSLVPGATWGHTFGLGGLFGDTVLGAFLTFLPLSAALGLKILSLLLGVGALIIVGFVLGVTRTEVRDMARFMALGVVMTYALVMKLLGKGANGAVHAAGAMQAKQAERREAQRVEAEARAARRMAAEPPLTQAPAFAAPVSRSAPVLEDIAEATPEPAPEKEKGGLLSRMPSLIKRADPAPEPDALTPSSYEDLAPEARIQSKIADVIKSRVRHSPNVQSDRVAPLTKGRGHGPQPMILDTSVPRVEPPMTATAHLVAEPALTAAPQEGAGLGFTSARMTPLEVQPESAFDHAPSEQLPEPELVDPREMMALDDAPSFASAPEPAAFVASERPAPKPAEPAKRRKTPATCSVITSAMKPSKRMRACWRRFWMTMV